MLSKETRNNIKEYRLAILPVSPCLIDDFELPADRYVLCSENQLPEDAEIMGMCWVAGHAVFHLYIASGMFESLTCGMAVPVLPSPTFEVHIETEQLARHSDPTVTKLSAFLGHMKELQAQVKLEDFVLWPAFIPIPPEEGIDA